MKGRLEKGNLPHEFGFWKTDNACHIGHPFNSYFPVCLVDASDEKSQFHNVLFQKELKLP